MAQPSSQEEAFIRSHRVARLATTDAQGRPHVVPICYAYDGRALYSPIDEKPKRVAPRRLRRLANIEANPQVALVIDDYREDWRRLAYVLVLGTAAVLEGGEEHLRALALLREKYPQYRRMALEERPLIKVTPARVVSWGRLGP